MKTILLLRPFWKNNIERLHFHVLSTAERVVLTVSLDDGRKSIRVTSGSKSIQQIGEIWDDPQVMFVMCECYPKANLN